MGCSVPLMIILRKLLCGGPSVLRIQDKIERKLKIDSGTKTGWKLFSKLNSTMHQLILSTCFRDHSGYAPSQWETALQCNAISHGLRAYTEWSWHLLKQVDQELLLFFKILIFYHSYIKLNDENAQLLLLFVFHTQYRRLSVTLH